MQPTERECPGCKKIRAITLFGSDDDPCAYCMANHVQDEEDSKNASTDDPTPPPPPREAPKAKQPAPTSGPAMAAQELAQRTLSRKHLLPFVERFNPKYSAGWVHKDIAQRLEKFSQDVADKKSPRLMLFMPPRHGKSVLASVAFPAWHLGNNPDHEIIACSYSASLAMSFSRKVRNMLREDGYGTVFPKTELDPDSQSTEAWLTTSGGGYVAAGVSGPITGKGAHCAYFNSLVTTKCGNKPISQVAVGDEVLGYDHVQRRAVWTRVHAVSTQYKPDDFVRVGDALLTPDHRVWTEEDGYVEVRTLCEGIRTLEEGTREVHSTVRQRDESVLQRSVPETTDRRTLLRVREQEGLARNDMQGLLPAGETYTANVPTVRGRLPADLSRGKEVRRVQPHGDVLQSRMLQQIQERALSFGSGHGQLQSLQQADVRQSEILFERVLPLSRSKIPNVFGYMEQRATGRQATLRGQVRPLREGERTLSGAPYQSHGNGPRSAELDPSLRAVPSPLSSADLGVCADDLAGLLPEPGEGSVRVVDIQTGTENFFLCGILTHNCLIIDDPVKNSDDAKSDIVKESMRDWYSSTAYTRLAPGGGVLLIMTRWADDDLAGWLLQEMEAGGEQWEVIKYPAIAECDEMYRDKDEALHPERYPLEALERIRRAVGPRVWSALYQQNPTPDTGDYFTTNMISYYNPQALDKRALNYYQAWDLAIGQNDRNDFTVGITVGLDKLDNMYIVDVQRGKWTGMQIVEKILDSYELWKPSIVGIERGHIELAIGPFLEKRRAERKLYEMYVLDLKTGRRDKEARARAIQGRLQQGKVLFPKDSGFTAALIGEMLRFPNGEHDDQVDALAWIGLMMADFSTPRRPSAKGKGSWKEKLDQLGVKPRSRSAMGA